MVSLINCCSDAATAMAASNPLTTPSAWPTRMPRPAETVMITVQRFTRCERRRLRCALRFLLTLGPHPSLVAVYMQGNGWQTSKRWGFNETEVLWARPNTSWSASVDTYVNSVSTMHRIARPTQPICDMVGAVDDSSRSWFSTYEAFVTARTRMLINRAFRVLQDYHSAEDVVAEVFSVVFEKWQDISNREFPDAYINKMLYNACISVIRKGARRLETVTDPQALPEDQAPDAFASLHLRDELCAFLATLSPQQRIVLTLRYLEDWNDTEIARALAIDRGTVRYHASTGLAKLRSASMLGEEAHD